MFAYIAGPLYNEGERRFDELIDQCAREAGFQTYLPHRDLGLFSSPEDSSRLFAGDPDRLIRADTVIANLDGMSTDAGTAWELGYAYATGKRLIGVRTDFRVHASHSETNPMISNSLETIVHSIDELREYLSAGKK